MLPAVLCVEPQAIADVTKNKLRGTARTEARTIILHVVCLFMLSRSSISVGSSLWCWRTR